MRKIMEVRLHTISSDTITEQELYDCRISEKRLTFKGKKYRVGRMNYGDYFLEPGTDRGEMSDFNPGTLWLVLADPKKRTYEVEDET